MITSDLNQPANSSLDELSTEEFLLVVGRRVRRQRGLKNMSRKRLAEVSGVSERYLAQLESGQGNMSIALLRKVTTAIGMSMGRLMSQEVTESCVTSHKRVAHCAQHDTKTVSDAPRLNVHSNEHLVAEA